MSEILLVEDDREIRESLNDMLELEDYKVKTAQNGKEALDYLNSDAPFPKVILLDIMMPVMNGYEFRKIQLESGTLKDIPTIVLSADRNCGPTLETLQVKHYLKKPIDLESLLSLISSYVK